MIILRQDLMEAIESQLEQARESSHTLDADSPLPRPLIQPRLSLHPRQPPRQTHQIHPIYQPISIHIPRSQMRQERQFPRRHIPG